jgi:hypothetical protein
MPRQISAEIANGTLETNVRVNQRPIMRITRYSKIHKTVLNYFSPCDFKRSQRALTPSGRMDNIKFTSNFNTTDDNKWPSILRYRFFLSDDRLLLFMVMTVCAQYAVSQYALRPLWVNFSPSRQAITKLTPCEQNYTAIL